MSNWSFKKWLIVVVSAFVLIILAIYFLAIILPLSIIAG